MFFCMRNTSDSGSDFWKSFFFGDLGESRIEIGVFVMFPIDGILKIF